MKKTIDFFKNMLAMIVNPRLILDFFRIKNLDRSYTRMMAKERNIRWVALAIALVAVISVRYTPADSEEYMEEIQFPLVVRIDEEAYTHFGSEIPSTVTVFLSGDRLQINAVRNSLEIFVDLNGLEEGDEHTVFLEHSDVSGRVTVRIEPQLITGVQVAPLIEREFSVEEDVTLAILPEIELGSRYVLEPTIEQEYITVRGPEILLDQIAEIRAIVDGNDIDTGVGTQSHTARLVANDIGGNAISVDIEPAELEVYIEIREHIRELNLEVNLTNRPDNVRVQRITVNPDAIEIWGLVELLIDNLTLDVSFNRLNNQGQIRIPLDLPDGVYSDIEEVEVRVDFTRVESTDND